MGSVTDVTEHAKVRERVSPDPSDNGGGSGRNAHRLIVEEDSIPAAVAGRTYGRMLGSSSGVDIKV